MSRCFGLIALSVFVVVLALVDGRVTAAEGRPGETALLLVDSTLGNIEQQEGLTISIGALYASSRQDIPHAISFFANSTKKAVPTNRLNIQRLIQDNLRAEREVSPSGMPDALEGLFLAVEYLSDTGAPADSRVLVVSSGATQASTSSDVMPVIDRLIRNGWVVDVAFLSRYQPSLLTNAALATDGKIYELFMPEVFQDLIQDINSANDDTNKHIQRETQIGTNFALTANVPPQTNSVRFVIYRQHSINSTVEVVRPDGTNIPARELTESPNLVIYDSPSDARPMAGQWRINTISVNTGLIGLVTEIDNPIEVVISNQTLPYALDNVLVEARTVINGIPITIDGITISANFRLPDSVVTNYSLLDDGTGGDLIAGDGVYSSLIAPINQFGSVATTVQINWPAQGVQLSAETIDIPIVDTPNFDSSSFNSVRINPIGEWLLAKVQVSRNGEPFYIAVDDINISFRGANSEFTPSVSPSNAGPGGYATFDLWGAPDVTDDYVIAINYSYAFDANTQYSIDYSSEERRITVSNLPPSFGARPNWLFGVPIWVIPTTIIALILIVSLFVWVLRKPYPHGFLYDEDGVLLDDLSQARRGIVKHLFSKSSVPADKLNLGLPSNLEFRFDRNSKLFLYYTEGSDITTIRIDGAPCLPRTVTLIEDGSWIGIRGRLIQVRYSQNTDTRLINQELSESAD